MGTEPERDERRWTLWRNELTNALYVQPPLNDPRLLANCERVVVIPEQEAEQRENARARPLEEFAQWLRCLSEEERRTVSLTGIQARADAALRRSGHEVARAALGEKGKLDG